MAEPDRKDIENGREKTSTPVLAEKEGGSCKDDMGSDAVGTDIEEGGTQQSASPEKETTKSEFTPAALLNLTGSICILFCSVGFSVAYGTFQEYYSQTLLSHKSPSEIAWIGSFALFIQFSFSLPVGYLNDLLGPTILVRIGSVIIIFALFMTSLCKQYYQLFLAQSLLLGIGVAFVFLPPFAILPRYFIRNRGAALGLTATGASIGGVIWPIALRNLFLHLSFGWTVRVCAFMMLPLLLFASCTIRLPQLPDGAVKPPKQKPDLSVAKKPMLLVLGASLFMNYLGLFTPNYYVTSYTISQRLDPNMAFYMLAIMNGSSLFGRIIPGILADRYGAFNVLILSAGTSGIVCMCWTKAESIAAIGVWSAVYGFTSGAIISVQGSCAAALLKPEQYGLGVGVLMAIWSIAALIGEPISGALLDKFEYLGLSLFAGLALILGMVILIIPRFNINSKLIAKV
ncbi:MFS monocarboxylate transporter-like protein [Stipitochalara longipes BDJ]|nr:MFS monocarboxylate transporter-like protein [Stipitochalara longipes BDJ]